MPRTRILVVDDAVVVRRLVTEVLSQEPSFEVVGTAANGKFALAKIPRLNPDMIILDVEMPEMNGLDALAEIRKTWPLLPVIMFSSLTQRGASTTLDALTLGANDYVSKPSNVGSVAAAMQVLRDELVPRIKALCPAGTAPDTGIAPALALPGAASPSFPSGLPSPTRVRIDIVAIGVSTGGPNALSKIMPDFPPEFPVPIVLVQHMPPMFTKLLAERLAAKSQIKVSEVVPGDILHPGAAWVAAGDFHMVVKRDDGLIRLDTNQAPPENSCRPAVDVLFRSVAEVYGPNTLAVILTGMGQDGFRGCEMIRERGGQIIAQDEASSVVWGMPGFVARAGLADQILPLDRIGGEILRRVRFGRTPTPANR